MRMNVVDSSGWLGYLGDRPNAGFFEAPILNTQDLLVPVICYYEVFERTLAEFSEEQAFEAIGLMSIGEIADLGRQTAIEAARISVEMKLAMADSIILASARTRDAILWTQDAHFKQVDGVRYIEK